MFGKAARFKDLKTSDIPGPGAYDPVDIDAVFDSHKRGAFLEKAERFGVDKLSDLPGPNAYAASMPQPATSRPPALSSAILNQQLDALKTRLEKEHFREVQQLEARATRAEARLQELNKEQSSLRATASKAEREFRLATQRLATLRTPLDNSETALTKKVQQIEENHAKTNQQQIDRIAHLELDLDEATRSQVYTASQVALAGHKLHSAQSLISDITSLYSQLHHSSVPKSRIRELELENAILELRLAKMGRKLGDREAQVNELVHMVRYLRDSNALLLEGVATAEGARQSSVSSMTIGSTVPPAGAMQLVSLMVDALQLSSAFFRSQSSTLHSLHTLEQTLVTNHRASSHALLLGLETDASIVETSERYASLVLSHFQHQVPQLTEKLSLQEAELAAVHSSACEQASRLQELQMRREEEIRRTQETEECLAIERDQTKRMRKEIGEKDGRLRKLAGEVEALRREEARLSTRIANMEESLNDNLQLQEEHRELLERVEKLKSRNVLAEDEMNYLSAFNAHILGHSNVHQRICYVDRIRKELVDFKQKLIDAEWERDQIREENAELKHELSIYISVPIAPVIPVAHSTFSRTSGNSLPQSHQSHPLVTQNGTDNLMPPPTALTRVGRQPLGAQNMNDTPTSFRDADLRKEVNGAAVSGKDGRMSVRELSG